MKHILIPRKLYKVVEPKVKDNTIHFDKGDIYSLSGTACDGFTMTEKHYQVVGQVGFYAGESINSVIVKCLNQGDDAVFSLSKNDCRCLNIEYEPGLLLFPRDMNWKLVKKNEPLFDENDIATYQLNNDMDGTYLTLCINNVKYVTSDYFYINNKYIIKRNEIEKYLYFCWVYDKQYIRIKKFWAYYDEEKLKRGETTEIYFRIYFTNEMLDYFYKLQQSYCRFNLYDFINIIYNYDNSFYQSIHEVNCGYRNYNQMRWNIGGKIVTNYFKQY